MDWTPATLPRVSQNTWDSLVTLGFVEERLDGEASDQRLLRLTEKRRRAADGSRYQEWLEKTGVRSLYRDFSLGSWP